MENQINRFWTYDSELLGNQWGKSLDKDKEKGRVFIGQNIDLMVNGAFDVILNKFLVPAVKIFATINSKPVEKDTVFFETSNNVVSYVFDGEVFIMLSEKVKSDEFTRFQNYTEKEFKEIDSEFEKVNNKLDKIIESIDNLKGSVIYKDSLLKEMTKGTLRKIVAFGTFALALMGINSLFSFLFELLKNLFSNT